MADRLHAAEPELQPDRGHRICGMRTEAARTAFYRRDRPQMSLEPETFDAVYNTAALSEEQLVASIAGIVAARKLAAT